MNIVGFLTISPGSLIVPWLSKGSAEEIIKCRRAVKDVDSYADLFTVIGLSNDGDYNLITLDPDYRVIQDIEPLSSGTMFSYMVIWDF